MKIALLLFNFVWLSACGLFDKKDNEADGCNDNSQSQCDLAKGCYFYDQQCGNAKLADTNAIASFQKDTRIFKLNDPSRSSAALSKILNAGSAQNFQNVIFSFKKGRSKGELKADGHAPVPFDYEAYKLASGNLLIVVKSAAAIWAYLLEEPKAGGTIAIFADNSGKIPEHDFKNDKDQRLSKITDKGSQYLKMSFSDLQNYKKAFVAPQGIIIRKNQTTNNDVDDLIKNTINLAAPYTVLDSARIVRAADFPYKTGEYGCGYYSAIQTIIQNDTGPWALNKYPLSIGNPNGNVNNAGPHPIRFPILSQNITTILNALRNFGIGNVINIDPRNMTDNMVHIGALPYGLAKWLDGILVRTDDPDEVISAILANLKKGKAAITTMFGASIDNLHYVSVVGMSDDGSEVLILDPAGAQGPALYKLSRAEFLRWMDVRGDNQSPHPLIAFTDIVDFLDSLPSFAKFFFNNIPGLVAELTSTELEESVYFFNAIMQR